MADLYNTINELERSFEEIRRLSQKEKEAIDHYLKHGGLIKIANKSVMEITYPSKDIIKKELSNLIPELNSVEDKIKQWEKIHYDAENFAKVNKVKKFFISTYWKHKLKEITDKEYKENFAKIKLPIDFVVDKDLNKVINTFIESKDYRSRLIDAVDNSIVYRNRSLGEKVVKKATLQKEISKTKLDVLYFRKSKLEQEICLQKVLQKWAG